MRTVVNDQTFLRLVGRLPWPKDPHRNVEHLLINGGAKQLGFIQSGELISHSDFVSRVQFENFHGGFLVFSNADLVVTWKEIYTPSVPLEEAHRRCGELLGYTDEQIEWFIGRRGGQPLS